ncbi:MAG: peptide deformylase [Opitutales bacterium]
MILRITEFGEPVLKEVGAEVTTFDADLKRLSEDMVDTMRSADGIGLAAQQVDKSLQICVVDVNFENRPPDYFYELDGKTPPLDLIMPMVLVNPKMELLPSDDEDYEEGCLSFPDIRGNVSRPTEVEVEYQDLDGNSHKLRAGGILARVIQHEVDHLNGVLFIDRMERPVVQRLEKKLKRLKRATRDKLKSLK